MQDKAFTNSADAVQIRDQPVESLVPNALNARLYSEEQIAQFAKWVWRLGLVNPVLLGQDGRIIAGHGRVLAAQTIGHKTVPAIVLEGLSEAGQHALTRADNGIALTSGWDEGLPAAERRKTANAGVEVGDAA